MDPDTLAVTRWDSLRAREPREERWTWGQLIERLQLQQVKWREEVGLWSPTIYGPTKRRGSAHVEAVTALVLDVDEVKHPRVIEDTWFLFAPWRRLLHTTWSHRWEAPRFRLILPLAEPVPGELWSEAWRWCASKLPSWLRPDRACSDAARIFWLPGIPVEPPRPPTAIIVAAWMLEDHVRYVEDGPPIVIPLDEVRREVAARKREAEKRRRRLRQSYVSREQLDREIQRRLRRDPQAREALAQQLGLRIRGVGAGRRAEGGVCPACGRSDVWWAIEPKRITSAMCNHEETCNWMGPLEEVAR